LLKTPKKVTEVDTGFTEIASSGKVYASVEDDIKLFTIENSRGTKLIVSNYGAAVVSLFIKSKAGKLVDVLLGYEDAQDYVTDEYYMGTVVGRFANRIAGDSVKIGGKVYKLSVREGGYHQHGGDVGFNKKLFDATPFRYQKNNGIIFRYTSPHLEEGFPGEFQLDVIYTLDEDNNWSIEYKGISDRNTLVNLTHHAYFNLSGHASGIIDEHEIKIPAPYFLPVNAMQVPTGELKHVANTPFDFTEFKKIGKDILKNDVQLELGNGYDHSFVLEKKHTLKLKHAAEVKESVSGIVMNVFTTEPAVHFYTGNFLKHIKGKNSFLYNKRSGFCLETQHYPDAPNNPSFPSTLLHAGEQFYSRTVYSFSTQAL
jgi:aldose 1-epimerase